LLILGLCCGTLLCSPNVDVRRLRSRSRVFELPQAKALPGGSSKCVKPDIELGMNIGKLLPGPGSSTRTFLLAAVSYRRRR
jgi:hypothetical protein